MRLKVYSVIAAALAMVLVALGAADAEAYGKRRHHHHDHIHSYNKHGTWGGDRHRAPLPPRRHYHNRYGTVVYANGDRLYLDGRYYSRSRNRYYPSRRAYNRDRYDRYNHYVGWYGPHRPGLRKRIKRRHFAD